jgi:hypothetical protein
MRLLRVSSALHDEGDVIHVDRLARIGLLDNRQEVCPNLVPDSEEVTTQGSRMLAREDLHIGIVVEQRALRPPGDEHGLVRPQHDPDKGFEALRPPFGRANRRRRPVVRPHERAHLPAAREKVQPFTWPRPAVHTASFPCSRRSGPSQLHALDFRSAAPRLGP